MEHKFYVHGMHCASCEILVEDKLSQHEKVQKVKASLKTQEVCLEAENDLTPEELSALVEDYGYKISREIEQKQKFDYKSLGLGLLIAGLVFGGFLLLQELGLVNLINPTKLTLPFVFFIGIIASLSTCMAVVGGLVLSLSSSFSQDKNYTPLVAFHLSRLISFFILGGLIGILGAAFTLNTFAYFILDTILFVVMVFMGLKLLGLLPSANTLQLKLPKSFGTLVNKQKNKKGNLAAALMGASTFILPCGFTQSMQLFSLTTGNFVQGALTMGVFALGTLPVLSLISFASFKFNSKLFFTTAGFLVLMFALFNFTNGLRVIGAINF